MYGYIYLTENLENGKCYIGQHKSYKFDKRYKGSGIAIKNAIKKYGKNNFVSTLIEECKTIEQLGEREKYWIEHCNANNSVFFYNISAGGLGESHPCSEETKIKISLNNGSHREEVRKKISLSGKGKHYGCFSEEHKRKISEANKGKPKSKEQIDKTMETKKKHGPYVVSMEARKKLGLCNKGKHWYNNGTICVKDFKCPEGFKEGRIYRKGKLYETKNK